MFHDPKHIATVLNLYTRVFPPLYMYLSDSLQLSHYLEDIYAK